LLSNLELSFSSFVALLSKSMDRSPYRDAAQLVGHIHLT
jgi:hypothetical protein